MACKSVCKLCDKLIISQSVTFADGTLTVNIPAGNYRNCCKYCIIIAQEIPPAATINAPVVITIGDGTVQYPLTNRCCSQVTACGIRTRTKYCTIVSTSATGGSFRLIGKPSCSPDNRSASINGTSPVTPAPTT